MAAPERGHIVVAAGTNGAGKSSIVEANVTAAGASYFNPDTYARKLIALGYPRDAANAAAWQFGHRKLRQAVDDGVDFAFETTLGGHSIAFELMRALAVGRRLSIYYVGLSSVDLHLQRVRERVARGGHDIPEEKVRERYIGSRENLLAFIGTKAGIRVWDNSTQTVDGSPEPIEIFAVRDNALVLPPAHDPAKVMPWGRPLLARAIKMCRG